MLGQSTKDLFWEDSATPTFILTLIQCQEICDQTACVRSQVMEKGILGVHSLGMSSFPTHCILCTIWCILGLEKQFKFTLEFIQVTRWQGDKVTGLHKSFDVLQSWAEPGSCSPSACYDFFDHRHKCHELEWFESSVWQIECFESLVESFESSIEYFESCGRCFPSFPCYPCSPIRNGWIPQLVERCQVRYHIGDLDVSLTHQQYYKHNLTVR